MGSSSSKAVFSVPVIRGRDGESDIYRCADTPSRLADSLDGVTTLYENFQCGLRVASSRPCLGSRTVLPGGTRGPFTWLSYKEADGLATQFGSGLHQLGVRPGGFLGIFSNNRAEWLVAELACHAYSLVPVPLYDTLGDDAVEFILRQAALQVVVCSSDKVGLVQSVAAAAVAGGRPLPLRWIVVMPEGGGSGLRKPTHYASRGAEGGDGSGGLERAVAAAKAAPGGAAATSAAASAAGAPGRGSEAAAVVSMEDVLVAGAGATVPHSPPSPEDLATICYTSGTTGDPKGAMLTHGNFAAALAGAQSSGVDLSNSDLHLSYLPLAHVFERIVDAMLIHRGAAIGFFSGDVSLLMDDLATLRPTIFPSVPRLFNRIHDKIKAKVSASGGAVQALFEYAYASKAYYLETAAGGHTTHSVWDALVFARMRELLGGRVRMMITGSAPIAPAVKEFLQVVFCCPVLEGYGLTETVGIATVTPSNCRHPGHVGRVPSCTEAKLVDVAEMGYTAKDTPAPRGELCLRGPNVFKGYYMDAKKTAEAVDPEGWFHTGDIARINEDGTVSIIDRKKNIFKLAQGEYVAPEKIEGVYLRAPLVAQVFLHGESVKSSTVVIVVPDAETLEPWAAAHGVPGKTMADWVAHPKVQEAIEAQLGEAADAAGLKGFERARAVHLSPEPFDVANGLLTPTFKLKRPQLKAYFATEIARLYAKLGD
ncbi:hypothetical protein FNF29_05478 [Cafeteria roenbergensis]|uniref:Long-chain-fatty-acid--CoA ligase n=1 Tax=Cafeteria roenbergensis TaxID=33653 RepID=A0A5A8DJ79_CAFRO|nr:hypothetical protein FNF29_05478 [Cafeteria roenbergensis]KAA0165258.1 hypothetical protein FNF31_01911 [Cafeteria roenbergensis]KAA0165432.1 hypothetical protein FNF28_03488 [Cafeteria roenbergensis]|eukprot:KAA0150037.1 hypothetical protein FNF29_05478 [Cafeteria roenbergensis]